MKHTTKIGELLRCWRIINEVPLRELARQTGVSIPTLNRLEHGYPPDGVTLVRVTKWIMENPTPRGKRDEK